MDGQLHHPNVSAPLETGHRLAALDGVRAVAVLAVIGYHFGVPGVHGGLLGVDVFFVLSGFLITSLLCGEVTRTGRLSLGAFWGRRARRLLPALFVLLLGVALYAHIFARSVDVSAIRADALATLLYVANWHFIVTGQGYFASSAAQSPLLHTWSLAVEEQYYLVWPLAAAVVLGRWGARALAKVALGGALASAVLMVAMHAAGFSDNRLYYGSDTRAQALLVGSFLGAGALRRLGTTPAAPTRWRALVTPTRWHARLAGLLGVGFLVWACASLDGQASFLYDGGFTLVALATGSVIVLITRWPASLVARCCALGPLSYVGRISYGLYLYHWPLCLAIDSNHTGLYGFELLVARLAATFAAAVVSFHLVEEPIRHGWLGRSWQGMTSGAAGALLAVGAVVLGTVTPAAGVVPRTTALTSNERQQLVAVHAFTTSPVRFLLLGDSIALTMGIGLSHDARSRYGIDVDNRSELGCDLDPTLEVRIAGQVGPATPGCPHWQQLWPQLVRQDRPQVVGLLLGRWEVVDHYYKGHWTHIGERVWDDHLGAELDQAVHILSSEGAAVALFTMPYLDVPNEAPNGSPYPENQPSRVNAYNRLVRQVAARTGATVVHLNALLDPGGRYAATLDGLSVRWSDGIHITQVGGEWLQPRLLPELDELGLAAHVSRRGA